MTLKANEEYELPSWLSTRRASSTIFVTVHKTSWMENEPQPQIQPRKQRELLRYADRISEAEPASRRRSRSLVVWNQSVADFYLGPATKVRLFSQNIFTGDYGELSDSENGSMRSNQVLARRESPDGGGRHTDESGDPGLTIKRDRL